MAAFHSLVSLFEGCSNGKCVSQLHSFLIKTCILQDAFVFPELLNLYSSYLPPENVTKLFDETLQRNTYSWNSILKCYCRAKNYKGALNLFSLMMSSEKCDAFTITYVLKACSGLRALNFGRAIHGSVKKNESLNSNLFIGSGLIELYSKCGNVQEAKYVYKEHNEPDVVLWTTMVTAFEQNNRPEEALVCFSRMVIMGRLIPDMITLVSVVSACVQLLDAKAGRSVHGFFIRREFDKGLSFMNALLNLYSKSGLFKLAASLFMKMEEKDMVSWGSMISCYAHNGAPTRALELLSKMMISGIQPNAVIVLSTLQACEASGNLEMGRKMHKFVMQKEFEVDVLLSTALIDMYMACKSPDEAVDVFKRIPVKDAISWSAIISGFVQNGLTNKALALFCDMLSSETRPDDVLMVKILTACSEIGFLLLACCLHSYLIKGGFDDNSFIGASLIESYAKCGSLDDAVEVFGEIKDRDLVVWSSMFAGYAVHGQGKESLYLFDKMIQSSAISPNNITFLSILSACSYAGLIEEGINFFNMMVNEYQLTPESKHYSIMVDLLGRTGELDQAMGIINQIRSPVGAHVWGALLGASRIHQNVEIGEVAAKNLFQLDPSHAGYHILLSSICALDGKWDVAADIRNFVNEKQLKKVSGHSVI